MDPLSLGPYRVKAFNTAHASENRIHTDAMARRFGFAGGLVPGVELYAYMTHLPVLRWGEAWLAGGWMTCRFAAPVYDGEDAIVSAAATAAGLDIALASQGAACAGGTAGEAGVRPALSLPTAVRPPAPGERPAASATSLAVGRALATRGERMDAAALGQYLRDIRETNRMYARDGLLHPGLLLRAGNRLLMENVVLGPWIHVGSTVHHLGLARVGAQIAAQGVVAANEERKGHQFVELDAVITADDVPVAQIRHVAIWRPRQLGEG